MIRDVSGMSSSGGKKKEGPRVDDQRIRIKCPQCDIVLLREGYMINHCYRIHFWSYKNNAPATPDELTKFNEKVADKKRKKGPGTSHTQTLAQKDKERELFGAVSDSVQLSSEEDSDEEEDIEPLGSKSSASIPFSKPDDSKKKKWSPTPKPVSEPEQPCERKKT